MNEVFKGTTEETGLATKLMKIVDGALQRNGGGKYLTGNDLTIADFALCSLFYNIFWNEKAQGWSPHFQAWFKPAFPRVEEYARALGEAQAKHLKERGPAVF